MFYINSFDGYFQETSSVLSSLASVLLELMEGVIAFVEFETILKTTTRL
jgi:hypothetical protein